jgi:hypothetical protein
MIFLSRYPNQGLDGVIEAGSAQVVGDLQVEPECRRGAEGGGKFERHGGGDAALFVADLVDDTDLHADVASELSLGNVMLGKQLAEEPAGMKRRFNHGILSMVINNFDLIRIALAPTKTDAITAIDANAVLTGAISVEFF